MESSTSGRQGVKHEAKTVVVGARGRQSSKFQSQDQLHLLANQSERLFQLM